MQIEDWALDRIHPYPNNPRVLRNAAEKVADSIREFGWRQPIVVDEDGIIIIGHARLAAAQLLKLSVAPVHVAKGLPADKVRALRLADNKTSEFADWDKHKLSDELAAIMASAGTVTATGFSQAEFDAIAMQAEADLAAVLAPAKPTAPAPKPSAPREEGPEPEEIGAPGDEFEAGEGETASSPSAPPKSELVQFAVLLEPDARAVLFDAISKAKRVHGIEMTADALLVIARSFLDA